MKYSVPVVCNETLWGTGTSMLTVIMGHMAQSQDMLAAYSLMGNIDKLSTVICFGLAASAAVMVGKEIGEGRDFGHVYGVAKTLLAVSVLVGLGVMALQLLLLPTFFRPVLFPLFQLSPGAARISTYLAVVYAVALPTRAFDVTNVTGVLRAGGDTRVAVLIDVLPLWLFTVPLMAVCALVLKLPVLWVCLCLQSETLCKFPLGILRFRSRKWIHDISAAPSAKSPSGGRRGPAAALQATASTSPGRATPTCSPPTASTPPLPAMTGKWPPPGGISYPAGIMNPC